MEGVVQFCIGSLCFFTPILLLLWIGIVYGLGVGSVKIPGIARGEVEDGKNWTNVPNLARKGTESLAATVSLIGALFGLIGFLLPWVKANIGGAAELFDLGSLDGTLSGIALAFQSLIAGFGLFATDIDGAVGLGVLLIVLSLLIWLIPIAMLLSLAASAGLISIPLGLLKFEYKRLSRIMLIASIISLCLGCVFFAGIQATVGGVKVGGSEGIFGTSISMGVEVANGFWISMGGLVLAMIGAIVANTLAPSLETWATNLTSLERDVPDEPDQNDAKKK